MPRQASPGRPRPGTPSVSAVGRLSRRELARLAVAVHRGVAERPPEKHFGFSIFDFRFSDIRNERRQDRQDRPGGPDRRGRAAVPAGSALRPDSQLDLRSVPPGQTLVRDPLRNRGPLSETLRLRPRPRPRPRTGSAAAPFPGEAVARLSRGLISETSRDFRAAAGRDRETTAGLPEKGGPIVRKTRRTKASSLTAVPRGGGEASPSRRHHEERNQRGRRPSVQVGPPSPSVVAAAPGKGNPDLGPRSANQRTKQTRERYLVDPASSHMLVSKIKPCMSKFTPENGETANGSLNQSRFLRRYDPTWITVAILELIHAARSSDRREAGRAPLLVQNQSVSGSRAAPRGAPRRPGRAFGDSG